MFLDILDLNNPMAVIQRFEGAKGALDGRVMARIYYATAQCKIAGASKSASEQLRWVRKGIDGFERLLRDYPDVGRVYLWQAITYSNFPSILGVEDPSWPISSASTRNAEQENGPSRRLSSRSSPKASSTWPRSTRKPNTSTPRGSICPTTA